jgi:hypothetical protein
MKVGPASRNLKSVHRTTFGTAHRYCGQMNSRNSGKGGKRGLNLTSARGAPFSSPGAVNPGFGLVADASLGLIGKMSRETKDCLRFNPPREASPAHDSVVLSTV